MNTGVDASREKRHLSEILKNGLEGSSAKLRHLCLADTDADQGCNSFICS